MSLIETCGGLLPPRESLHRPMPDLRITSATKLPDGLPQHGRVLCAAKVSPIAKPVMPGCAQGRRLRIRYGSQEKGRITREKTAKTLFSRYCLPISPNLSLLEQRFVARGQGRIFAKAKWHATKKLPQFWKKRQAVQRVRRASWQEIWQALDKSLWRS